MYPRTWAVRLVFAAAAPALWSALLASQASAAGGDRCSVDNLPIDGQRVAATFCVVDAVAAGPNKPVRVTVSESLVGPGGNLSRTSSLDFVADDPARAIDDIPLAVLGIKKTLHSTFLYSGGTVKLEHALLVPGAVTVK
ncbi:MAG: hypothetical protein JO359_08235 [Candidatus Eremiobacteraeota bacterium]|nr:hypothetical protein [Candidatus Eremiobacteraeota bacterium]